MELLALALLVVGLALGFAVGRLLARSDSAAAIAERDSMRNEYAGMQARADQLVADLRLAENALAETRATLEAERVAGAQRVEAERRTAAEKLALLEQTQDKLKEQFRALSSEALERSNTQFLELAGTQFKAAGRPLTETLEKVETQLRAIERDRVGAQESLKQQIEFVRTTGEDLRRETASLVSALRKPQARGQWGELHLRRAVELAGMSDRCDFNEQQSVTTSEGTLRPDLVVRLVGGKSVVVDSKVTLAAYLQAHEATDEAVREERLVAHARHLRDHVNSLAAKAYWNQFTPTPEFVVLFVPGEAFLAPALERDPTLLEDAFGKRVHIATPTTLVSTLRTVAYAWQQEALASNAAEVFELGRTLYSRLSTFGDHMDKLGRALTSATGTYNKAVGSLERQVLVTARKLNDLEVVEGQLEPPLVIEEPVRTLSAPELLEAATPSRPQLVLPEATLPEATLPIGDEAAAG
ncbi:MAG: recombination protein RmuC [Frankiaceae bacterium]|jgi:DNA recombination protein RmuC|nr:recombination protein RmuC [Frankiaceae bacterium]